MWGKEFTVVLTDPDLGYTTGNLSTESTDLALAKPSYKPASGKPEKWSKAFTERLERNYGKDWKGQNTTTKD